MTPLSCAHLRKNAGTRGKELEQAIARIERGRSRTQAAKLSISAVAREAGVTPALIHNHYPSIAEEIRSKQGASSRQQRDAKRDAIRRMREKNRALLQELKAMKNQLAKLASINEMLLLENRIFKASQSDAKVVNVDVLHKPRSS